MTDFFPRYVCDHKGLSHLSQVITSYVYRASGFAHQWVADFLDSAYSRFRASRKGGTVKSVYIYIYILLCRDSNPGFPAYLAVIHQLKRQCARHADTTETKKLSAPHLSVVLVPRTRKN